MGEKYHFDKLGTFALMGVVASWALGPLVVRFFSETINLYQLISGVILIVGSVLATFAQHQLKNV